MNGLSKTLLAVAVAVCGQAAFGASIGIHFGGEYSSLDTGDVAGVVPQDHWNNLSGHAKPIPVASVVDNVGNATAVTATWYQAGGTTWQASNGFAGGDQKLMSGGLESYAMTDWPSKVENLTGISYGDYDVYVYFSGGGNNLTPGASVSLAITGTGSGGGGTSPIRPLIIPARISWPMGWVGLRITPYST